MLKMSYKFLVCLLKIICYVILKVIFYVQIDFSYLHFFSFLLFKYETTSNIWYFILEFQTLAVTNPYLKDSFEVFNQFYDN